MKLKSQLREASLELLLSISEFWGLRPQAEEDLSDAQRLGDYLYPRLQAHPHFRTAFERLDTGQREIVYLLALHGGELPQDEFKRRSGLHDRESFQDAFGRLNESGFIWREKISDGKYKFNIVGLPEPFVRLIELPPYWQGFLGYFLPALSLDDLRGIAKNGLGHRYEGRKKQVLVHFVRNRLLDPKTLREIVENQDGIEAEYFSALRQRGGTSVWRELIDEGVRKKFDHRRTEALQNLVKHSGLAFQLSAGENQYSHLVLIPKDIQHTIQNGFRRDERTIGELSRGSDRPGSSARESATTVILDNTQNIVRDLTILVGCAVHHQFKVLNNGGVGRNDLKKIVPLLSHNKTLKYASFLALFAMSKKLIVPVGDRWRASKDAGHWFGEARECYRSIYDFWLNTNEWNEEYVEGDVLHVDHYPHNLISITELRKLVLRVLTKTPLETWVDFETFASSLLPQVAIEIPSRFEASADERSNRHIMLILESIVAESLYWLGVVTLGVSDLAAAQDLGSRSGETLSPVDWSHAIPPGLLGGEEYVFSFKVSATAVQVFEGHYLEPDKLFRKTNVEGMPYAEESRNLTVQPNLEVITPPDFNLQCFFEVLGFANIKKVDVMTTLTISHESVRQGMQHGLNGDGIVEYLEAHSRQPIPETVVQLIRECSSRHGEVNIGLAGGYIAGGDRIHIAELRANPRIARHIKDVMGDKVILLNRGTDLRKIGQEIQKMGFLAREASDSVHVTGEGLFHVTLRQTEFHDLLAILGFAQDLEDKMEGSIFEDRLRALLEKLESDIQGEFNPDHYVHPLLATFQNSYAKLTSKKKDEENRKLKKQVNRLLTRVPRRRESIRYGGENPTSDSKGVVKMFKFAIENEMQVKIHYLRSTGEEIDEVIEPESIQGRRVYALCPEHDEHHIYVVKRILQAAI